MRLLQICTDFPGGGIQRHVLDLGASLRMRGHCVYFAGAPGKWMNKSVDATFLPLELDAVSAEGGALPRRLLHLIKAAARLRTFIGRERIELIHAHESAPALVARVATIGLSTPILLTYHGSDPGRIAQFGRIARAVARRVITPSQRGADDLRRLGGVAASKLRVIGLGIGAAPAVDEAAIRQLRNELLGARGQRLVVTVARLAHQKAIDVLIEVARRTTLRDERIRFVVVGDGPLRDDVRRWASEAAVDRHVTFVGHSERPHDFLAAADLFLLTSRWEGLPIAIVEAFRAGLPVVATDAGGVRELVDDSVGKVVAIDDVEALTEQVSAVCADDAQRARLSANALARAGEERFTPSHVHGIFERTYAEALGVALPNDAHA